jgi:hypothetical protein
MAAAMMPNGTVRPNAPCENGGVANGGFRRPSYSDLAVSAADSFGLLRDVLTIAYPTGKQSEVELA